MAPRLHAAHPEGGRPPGVPLGIGLPLAPPAWNASFLLGYGYYRHALCGCDSCEGRARLGALADRGLLEQLVDLGLVEVCLDEARRNSVAQNIQLRRSHHVCMTTEDLAARLEARTAKLEQDRLTITIQANVAAFEKAIDEQFKPALRKAMAEVVDEFLSDVTADSMSITEGGAE